MKTYGKATWENLRDSARWAIEADPHIVLRIKRVFERISKGDHGVVYLDDTLENCRDLEWFEQRYPLEMSVEDRNRLAVNSSQHRDHILKLEQLIDPSYTPRAFDMAIPPRDYQARAAEIYLKQGDLMLVDELGLGKTCSAICSFRDARTLPAVVVCHPFLQRQWADEIKKFTPDITSHILKKTAPYELPKFFGRGPDVVISSYHKLHGWSHVLSKYAKSVIFDEAQELRRTDSGKYRAAKHLADAMKFRLGLTATPIYNMGVEMFNLCDVITPGKLGRRPEFEREWCDRYNNGKVKNPKAFGSYLRESFTMLRRTRSEVGRELPSLIRVPYQVSADKAALDEVKDAASELAKIILGQTLEQFKGERLQASEQLSNVLRQATGIAKAPHVADFVRLLLESEEKVVLCGWHRAVYDIWAARLKEFRPAWFTGSESGAKKEDEKKRFVEGDARVLFLSLRSGAGLDGLQYACRTIAIGELDWSPAVIEQNIGRVYRDGQPDPVTAYFLVSETGADPTMSEVLGLKREQLDGIRTPDHGLIEKLESGGEHAKRLAEHYMKTRGGR
jgi:SNF2 family DNA or RNA helicase